MKDVRIYFALALTALIAGGCTTTQKGALIGSGVGAGTGAIIGHQSGHTKEGALIGAAVGALGGALIGDAAETKFCPVDGKGFTGGVQYCPEHGVALKVKGQANVESQPQKIEQAPAPSPEIKSESITATEVKGLVCPKCNKVFSTGTYCSYDGTKLEKRG